MSTMRKLVKESLDELYIPQPDDSKRIGPKDLPKTNRTRKSPEDMMTRAFEKAGIVFQEDGTFHAKTRMAKILCDMAVRDGDFVKVKDNVGRPVKGEYKLR